MPDRFNLKRLCMELGNRLVKLGATPADHGRMAYLRRNHLGNTRGYPKAIWRGDPGASLEPLVLFTEWLNAYPDARNVLDELGMDWPIVSPMGDAREDAPGSGAEPPELERPKLRRKDGVRRSGIVLATVAGANDVVGRVTKWLDCKYGTDCCDRYNHWDDALKDVLLGSDTTVT